MNNVVAFSPKAAATLKQIQKDILLAGVRRGDHNEDRVEEVLRFLIQRGDIFTYYRCLRDGENDRLGWDFFVMPEADWMIPLQVKSSATGQEAHERKHGDMRIMCVVVRNHVPVDVLAEEILEVLGLSTKALEETLRAEAERQSALDVLGQEFRRVFPED